MDGRGMKHLTDHELMKIVQAGDHSPASELYDRYSKRIYNFAWRMLRNADLAEDATQEAFLRMIRYANTYKENSSVGTWLFAITANWCRDHFRRLPNRTPTETDDVLVTLPASGEDSPDRRYEQGANARLVKKALDNLSHDQREAITLARYNEMSHADIAVIAGCSVGAVKTRIFRGLEAMRHYLTALDQVGRPAEEAPDAATAEETPAEETNV
jgi:RNA polymerase sigma factor (sigma-70 family)